MAHIEEIVNKVCKQLPEGYEIQLCMENGAGYVTLLDGDRGEYVALPDSTDKTIAEQLNDALCVANKFV